ncbi:MAG: hypothetical protein KDK65_04140 [Chlamydiia bacterium]|nr:hypothetical protein [Chlamydiia bacterium]
MTKEFENEHVKGSAEALPGCLVHFDVQVNRKATVAARDKAVRTVTKSVTLPGFRKGKAPKNLVEQKYGSQIEQEFRSVCLRTTLFEVNKLTETVPFPHEQWNLKIETYEPQDEGMRLVYKLETFPLTPTIELEKLEIAAVPVEEVKEEHVNETLKGLQLNKAEWTEVTDRPATKEDRVMVDIDIKEGESFQQVTRSAPVNLFDENIRDWLRTALIGMSQGESKTLIPKELLSKNTDLSKEDEWIHKEHKIDVVKVEHPTYPEVDEKLAKDVGADDLEDLKQKIHKQHENDRQSQAQNQLRQNMQILLLEKYAFELPQSMNDKAHAIAKDWAAKMPADQRPEEVEIVNDLLNDTRLSMLLQQLAKEHQLELTSDEIKAGTLRLWTQGNYQNPRLSFEENLKHLQEEAPKILLREKVLDFLVAKAKKS